MPKRFFAGLAMAAVVILLVIALGAAFHFTEGEKRLQLIHFILHDLAIPLVVSLAAAVMFWVVVEKKADEKLERSLKLRETESEARLDSRAVKIAKEINTAYSPTDHFSLSNEGDDPFHQAIMEDLKKNSEFYFSGLLARVSVARIAESREAALKTALLRLPLSEKSLKRAATMRLDLINMAENSPKLTKRYTEISGNPRDRPGLYDLAKSKRSEDSIAYISELAVDAVTFAWLVTRTLNVEFLFRDWDENTDFRIERTDRSIYMGNYNPILGGSKFCSGTSQFSSNTFIYKLFDHGINSEIFAAKTDQTSSVIKMGPGDASLANVLNLLSTHSAGKNCRLAVISEYEVDHRFSNFRQEIYEGSEKRF